jgi:hypothetical protein
MGQFERRTDIVGSGLNSQPIVFYRIYSLTWMDQKIVQCLLSNPRKSAKVNDSTAFEAGIT